MSATPQTIKAALEDPAAFATTMVMALVSAWDTEWLAWDPATVNDELLLYFRLTLGQSAFDRLMAGVTFLTSDQFHRQLPAFVSLASAVNGDGYRPDQFDPPACEDLAWAISESILLPQLVFGREDQEPRFAAQIRGYLGMALDHEGITDPPDVLRLAIQDRPDLRRQRLDSWARSGLADDIAESQGRKTSAITYELKGRLHLLLSQLGQLWNIPTADAARLIGAPR